jgi:hypothetical protein
MPMQNAEQVDARLERAKKKLAGLGDGTDVDGRRAARKRVKRLQRKKSRVARAAARRSGADAKGGSDS